MEEGRAFEAHGRERSLHCLSGVDDSLLVPAAAAPAATAAAPAATAAAATETVASALVGGSMRLFKELYVETES